MRRESRMILVMVVFAVGGLTALMMMSQRYGRMLSSGAPQPSSAATRPASPPPPELPAEVESPPVPQVVEPASMEHQAQSYVDRFIVARREIRRSLVAAGTLERIDDSLLDGLLAKRDEALVDSSLGRDEYMQLRTIYRAWREDGLGQSSAAFSAAFEQRRDQIARIDLGVWESSEL